MTGPLKLQVLDPADLATACAINAAAGWSYDDLGQVWNYHRPTAWDGVAIQAWAGGVLVGQAELFKAHGARVGHYGTIRRFLLAPAWQDRGVAAALLGEVETAARGIGCVALEAVVDQRGLLDAATYQSRGYGDHWSWRLMTRDLGPPVKAAMPPGPPRTGEAMTFEVLSIPDIGCSVEVPGIPDWLDHSSALVQEYHDDLYHPEATFGAYLDGRLVGKLEMSIGYRLDRGRYGAIRRFGIAKEHRNQGYGTSTLKLAEDHVRALGGTGVDLLVDVDNPDAQRLYQRLGYRQIREERMVRGAL